MKKTISKKSTKRNLLNATARKNENLEPERILNHHLSPAWFDYAEIMIRMNSDQGLIRLFSHLPDPLTLVEVGRYFTDKASLKHIAERLCAALDYYPTKDRNKRP